MATRILYLCSLSIFVFLVSSTAFAADGAQFEPLVGIPGITDTENATLPEYINSLYMILIAVGGMIAVVRIVFAGVKYSLTDVVTNKGEAKEDIKGVLLGLVLLLLPWIVLNTIYPNLTNLDILKGAKDLPGSNSSSGTNQGSGTYTTPEGTISKPCMAKLVNGRAKSDYDSSTCKAECTALGGTLSDSQMIPLGGKTICTYRPKDTLQNPSNESGSFTEAQSLERLKCFREGSEYSSVSKSCTPGVTGPKTDAEKRELCTLGGGVWQGSSCENNLANNAVMTFVTNSKTKEEIDAVSKVWQTTCAGSKFFPHQSGEYTTFMCVK